MLAMPPALPITPRQPAQQPPVSQTVEAPTLVQTVTVTPTPSRSDLLAATENWTWMELRDYVVAEITSRFGPFPRDSRKEHGIFSRFLNTYGQDGIEVAKFAFGPVCDGWWGSAPISVNRFCKGSDAYFCQPILARLAELESTVST